MVSNKIGYTSQLTGHDYSKQASSAGYHAQSRLKPGGGALVLAYGGTNTNSSNTSNAALPGPIAKSQSNVMAAEPGNTNKQQAAGGQAQVSSEAKQLIRTLLTVEEAQRPTAFDIL